MFSEFPKSVVGFFLPANLKADEATIGRCRIFISTHLTGPVLGLAIIGALFYLDPRHGFPIYLITACIAWFPLLPFALKWTGNLQAVAFFSFFDLTFITLYGSFHYGGVSSPFMPWLLAALMLGFFYLGNRPRLVLYVVALLLAGFFAAYLLNGGFPDTLNVRKLSGLGLVSVVTAMIFVSMMALYYLDVDSSQAKLLKEAERQAVRLNMARESAEQANQAKSAFLAKMNHGFRTPLNAIIGYSEILLEDAVEEDREDRISDLKRINNAGTHILSLLTGVFDISKIETDDQEDLSQSLRTELVDMSSFLSDVASTTQGLVAKNSNQLATQFEDNLGDANCDPTKLRQIIYNLISNAAKFTENGTITIDAKRQDADAGPVVRIDIRDTGIGISNEALGRLFHDYEQVHAATRVQYGGTGLGLALSKRLCQAMGGDIADESELGKGSCFTVTIPAGDAAKAITTGDAETVRGDLSLDGGFDVL